MTLSDLLHGRAGLGWAVRLSRKSIRDAVEAVAADIDWEEKDVDWGGEANLRFVSEKILRNVEEATDGSLSAMA